MHAPPGYQHLGPAGTGPAPGCGSCRWDCERQALPRSPRALLSHPLHEKRQNTGTPPPGGRGWACQQSDTPPVLAPRCEELECDVIGVSK
jgi:hypothetical protein